MSASSQSALFTNLGFDSAYLSTFEDKLFIEGPQTARHLTNFSILLLLATVIATYGCSPISLCLAGKIGFDDDRPEVGHHEAGNASIVGACET
jgi:hypothetical protein